jgi:hypothetical protein
MVPAALAISANTPMGASFDTTPVIHMSVSRSTDRGSITAALFGMPMRPTPIRMLNTTTAGTSAFAYE